MKRRDFLVKTSDPFWFMAVIIIYYGAKEPSQTSLAAKEKLTQQGLDEPPQRQSEPPCQRRA